MLYSFRACYTKAVIPVSQVTEAGVEDKRPYNEGKRERLQVLWTVYLCPTQNFYIEIPTRNMMILKSGDFGR